METINLIDTGTSLLTSNFIDINILLTTILTICITLLGLTLGFLLLRLQSNLFIDF